MGTDIDKGVYYALVLTIRNPEKISNAGQKQSSGECPVGMLYTAPFITAQPLVYPYTLGSGKYKVVAIYIIGVGLRRCSFRLAGPFSGASNREASDSAGLHVFFVS